MQLADWQLVEEALLLIGLTQISFVKAGFDGLGRDKSSFRLSAVICNCQTDFTVYLHLCFFRDRIF
jgi:hypothetical protein